MVIGKELRCHVDVGEPLASTLEGRMLTKNGKEEMLEMLAMDDHASRTTSRVETRFKGHSEAWYGFCVVD
jgi:hypothetical protein